MDIRLSSGTVIRVFSWLIAILLAGHLIGQVIRIETGHDSVFGLIPLFDFYDEANLPTWTSNILLVASSFMLLLIGLATRAKGGRYVLHWFGLAVIFLFLAADEVADIHPIAGRIAASGGDFKDTLQSVWVVPYAALVLAVGVVYLRFLFSLPIRTVVMFAIAAVGFVFGTIGLEVIEDRYLLGGGSSYDATFMLLVTIEELLELTSIALFLYACFDYQRRQFGDLRVTLTP